MKQLTVKAIKQVNGRIRLPGSKSISNRALLLAALSSGKTTVTNLLFSDDVRFMLDALKELGVKLTINESNFEVTVEGLAGGFSVTSPTSLFLGNAGTAMRPLCAALALSEGEFELTGEPRMKERPIAHLVDALRSLGASIDYQEAEGYPPLKITGTNPTVDKVEIDGSLSSQYITALLLASPLLPNGLTLTVVGQLVSRPYIDITIGMMKAFGVEVEEPQENGFYIKPGQHYQSPGRYLVEGDASSASYFLAAAAINGGEITVEGVGKKSVQGDIGFAHVLEKMGADIIWEDEAITCRKNALHGVSMDMNHIPDAAMTIATTALFADSPSTISNVYNWRIKETDRLHAMATELKKLGAKVEEGNDYLKVWPLENPAFVDIDTYNDHRVAMCFSLVAVGGHDIIINDPDCTHKTFPTYFELLETIAVR
jgi:3-phosphoshikimate 1-carboxyvinyltransferase